MGCAASAPGGSTVIRRLFCSASVTVEVSPGLATAGINVRSRCDRSDSRDPGIMHIPTSGPAVASGAGSPPAKALTGAYFALVVLFSMNLLNYIDRYVFAAVGPSIQAELHLRDRRFGYLASAFMIVYTIVAPVIGWLGDRYSRRRLIAFGVGLWGVATVGTAFAQNYRHMFFWRALLGVGEASYGVVAPTLLADLFPP